MGLFDRHPLFGGGGGDGPDYAGATRFNGSLDQAGIDRLAQEIASGQFKFGHPSDKPAVAIKAFQQTYGRNPTPAELQQVLPEFEGPNGNAAVSNLYANSPEYGLELYTQNSKTIDPKLNGLFSQYLGREATDAEKRHFGQLLASNQVDDFTLGTFLQQLPEARQKQDKDFRESVRGDLQKSNADYYSKYILPEIQSKFASQGRSVESSGFQNSTALAAKDQQDELNSYLANLSASQYGSNKDAARADYEAYYGRKNKMADDRTNRINSLQDYGIQRDAYNDYIRRFGQRNKNQGYGQLIGGIAGLGAGLSTGNPYFAGLGYQAGSGIGGAAGGLY